MPVKLWTGKPGHGKTAAMVAGLLEFKRVNPDRPVYAIGIDGMHESVAQTLTQDELERWWELPPGALIAIDEAQKEHFMPSDGGKPSAWVRKISEVRHEGMDFWLTTQDPALISNFVRRLVDDHVHFERKFNTHMVMRFQWPRCMENCSKPSAQKAALQSVVTLPKEVFDLYKSSNAHNMKRRIPIKAYVLPVAVAVALAALIAVPFVLHRIREKAAAPAASTAQAATVHVDGKAVDESLRRTDFAKWMKPRIDGIPWSAPAYDTLEVRSVPKVYCVAVDDGRCSCMTEQGTRYGVEAKRCREIAANGLYNPFVADRSQDEDRRSQGRTSPSVEPQARTAEDPLASGLASEGGGYKERATAVAYLPPEQAARPAYSPTILGKR